jgi:hypothetical protein
MKYYIYLIIFIPFIVSAQKNTISVHVGYPQWSKVNITERIKTNEENNMVGSLIYSRSINNIALYCGIEYMNSNIRMDYISPVPAWAAQTAIYKRKLYHVPVGINYPLLSKKGINIGLTTGMGLLHSDRMKVSLINENSGTQKIDTISMAQDYKHVFTVRNGFRVSYTLKKKWLITMGYTLDFRLRDFYKEDYTWTIWNNKRDARMATIFSGGVGYKW